jgi:N4-gp56 family major capsid protein
MTELTVPSQVYLSADSITATLIQRGAYAQISDLVAMTAIDPILEDAADLMGEKAAITVDTYIRDEVGFIVADIQARSSIAQRATLASSGVTVRILSGTSSGEGFALLHNKARIATSATVCSIAKTALSVKSIMHAVKTLRANDAEPFDDGYFVGVVHPEVVYQLETDPSWQSWNQYTNPQAMYKGEIGKIGGVRFLASTNAPSYALTGDTLGTGSGDMYGTIIVGKHAYGVTEVGTKKSKGYQLFVKHPSPGNTADPVDQKHTIGFKTTMAAKILNKSAGVIVLSTRVTA